MPVRRLTNTGPLGPLFKSFESGSGGQAASMDPSPRRLGSDRLAPRGARAHGAPGASSSSPPARGTAPRRRRAGARQDRAVGARGIRHRRLPAARGRAERREDELGARGRAVDPARRASVIHGDGDSVDAFADVIVVNYDVLDRHMAWLSTLGFRGMVVDEAHFIKNLQSLRSRNVLALADRIRATRRAATRCARPHGDPPSTTSTTSARSGSSSAGSSATVRRPNCSAGSRRRASRPPTPASTPRRAVRSSTSESSAAGRRMSPPTFPRSASPTCPSNSTTSWAARSALRARARHSPREPLPRTRRVAQAPRGRPRRARARPVHPRRRALGTRGVEVVEVRRERLHDGAAHRPGQGGARGRLRRAACPLGRQGRLLRQAHRRHGPGRAAFAARELRTVSVRGDQNGIARRRRSTRSTPIPRCRSRCARSPPRAWA